MSSAYINFTIKISSKATNIRGWAISISEGKRRQIVSRNVTVWRVGWFIMYRVRWYTTRDGVVVKHCHRVASSWRDISWAQKNCKTFKNTTQNCTLITAKPMNLDRIKRFKVSNTTLGVYFKYCTQVGYLQPKTIHTHSLSLLVP